jgi:hypothetical protein
VVAVFFVSSLLCVSVLCGGVLGQGSLSLAAGDSLPDLSFGVELSKQDAEYLGLDGTPPVEISRIDADLLVVQLLVVQCLRCQKQAPLFEEAYGKISEDKDLAGRVRFLGIAIGNSRTSIEKYKTDLLVSFPILPDDTLEAFKKLGGPGAAPFTILVRRDADGRQIVASTHAGSFSTAEELLNEIRASLDYDVSFSKSELDGGGDVVTLESPISTEKISRLITQSADTLLGSTERIDLVKISSGQSVYVVSGGQGGRSKTLFARVESRKSVCADCRDAHFLYLFDETGKILDFIPISLTKYRNMPWNKNDVSSMKRKVIGKSLPKMKPLDPGLDAVTGATITSVLIFDSLRDGSKLYEDLRSEGHAK